MKGIYNKRFQIVPLPLSRLLLFFLSIICQNLWASQTAIVVAEEALVYADDKMSAPVGYVRKGKKIIIGEIPRNRSQVYPIIVSGKVAFIRSIDVTTAKESATSNELVAERFLKIAQNAYEANYSAYFFNYSSQISIESKNASLKDKDPVNWFGVGIKGGVKASPSWSIDLLFNAMNAKSSEESFNILEFGIGASATIFDLGRFKTVFNVQALAIPFANYAVKDDFRVNGFGFSAGSGLSLVYRFSKNWGVEAFGGFYYSKISKFASPSPYDEISPSFIGQRAGLGVNYQF